MGDFALFAAALRDCLLGLAVGMAMGLLFFRAD